MILLHLDYVQIHQSSELRKLKIHVKAIKKNIKRRRNTKSDTLRNLSFSEWEFHIIEEITGTHPCTRCTDLPILRMRKFSIDK